MEPLILHTLVLTLSLQFRTAMFYFAPLRRVAVDDVDDHQKNMVIRTCYCTFSVWSGVPIAIPERIPRLEGERPLVPVKIPILQGVNADLIIRYRYLLILWQFQKYPIVAADQGLMKITQLILDSCLAIAMPDRPLTSKTSRQRRASFSALQDIRSKPRLPLKPPCHCERRLMI
ncbi:uncharacterized protein B0H18DRAFT_1045935, partial [Fomitopsis serialis]